MIPGVASIAAPVFTGAGPLPLVVGVVLPDSEATDTAVADIADALLATTRAMSAELGHVNRPA